MKVVTAELIRDIFYSGQFGFKGDSEIAAKIAFLINNNYLLFSPVTIATKVSYLEICSSDTYITKRDDAAGGSREHVALKILGQEYIKKLYGLDSVFEHNFNGYYPDVQSTNNQVICECGHTDNAEKIFNYFRNNEVRYVIQIPYPSDTDDQILGYEFQAASNLISFLDFESKERVRSIKSILNNR